MARIWTTLVTLFFCSAVQAQDASRFLVPVVVGSTPGAYGAEWVSELWAHNASSQPVEVHPLEIIHHVILPGSIEQLPLSVPLPPRPPALFIRCTACDGLALSLRAFDKNSPFALKAQVPIVPAASIVDTELSFFPVSVDSLHRFRLRIYSDAFKYPDVSSVHVTVSPISAPGVTQTLEVPLTQFSEHLTHLLPAHAEISLDTTFAILEGEWKVDVRSDSGIPIWAFLSITSDLDNSVVAVSPTVKGVAK